MNTAELIGYAAAVITTASFLPQLARAWKTRKTQDVSLLMLIALSSGIILWLIYGIMIGKMPIIAANAVTLVLVGAVLALKIRFG